jgi:L-Lysine epsilon oxidase N-terminal/L-lysine epsilon oxidase C-terminal domain
MPRRFRIHPAIGIARVGNSPDGFFVGPEQPGVPGNWGGQQFNSFRDEQGRIKRQAARFRVFEYPEDGSAPKEVKIGTDLVSIEWRVHVANKKASFFTFDGQHGAEDAYVARAQRPATDPQKDDPPRLNRRNPLVPLAALNLDPGEQLISKKTSPRVVLTNTNPKVTFIPDLGELRLDDEGHLLVLGGHGTSGSTATPPVAIDEYANNDTWFDDAGDGSVKARLQFADGTFVDADAAWLLVGPPKFAAGIDNVVRLYDVLWDLAVRTLDLPKDNPLYKTTPLGDLVRQQQAWRASGGQSLAGYRPSFLLEIYPLLSRALAARDVHDPGEINRGFHVRVLSDWTQLAQADTRTPNDPARELRQYVFSRMRNPRSTEVNWKGMPRGLGDNYDDLDNGQPVPTSFLSLTQTQYALLQQWANGEFDSDWPGTEPGIPTPAEVTPQGLDFAAMEHCVGGPFYPGIEVSWLIHRPEIYAEPFRLRVPRAPDTEDHDGVVTVGAVTFAPGFFTQQMALPWQADFYDCHKEKFTSPDGPEYFYMWWTAQRPDDAYPAGKNTQARWVRPFDSAKTGDAPDALDDELARFEQMQKRWPELRFIIRAPQGTNHDFEEEPQ